MSLDSEDLARLVEGAAPRLTPEAASQAIAVAAQIRAHGISATTESANSRSLQSIMRAYPGLIDPLAPERLAELHLFGVESMYINAFATHARDGRGAILVFEGLLHLVHYFADLITLLGLLQSERPGAVIDDGSGGVHPEAQLFSMAGFALLSRFLETRELPPLLHDLMGETPRANVKNGFNAAAVFIVLHELAHLTLGHASPGEPFSEAGAFGQMVGEETVERRQELEADAQALMWITPEYRGLILSSLIFLLGAYAFMEAFTGALSQSHPLAVKRLRALAAAAELPDGDREIVESWIEDRARNDRDMADARRTAGGSICGNIYQAMSVEQAWAIVREVRRRIVEEHGVLG